MLNSYFPEIFAKSDIIVYICGKLLLKIKEESKGYLWESIGLYCRH